MVTLRRLLAVAVLAVLPVSANAVTVMTPGGTLDVNSDTLFQYFDAFVGGQLVDLDFGFSALSETGATAALVTLEFGGDVTGLQMNWALTDLNYLNGTGFSGATISNAVIVTTLNGNQEGSVSTVFNLVLGLSQVLNIGFLVAGTAAQAIILNVQVSPVPVPLPAALPLLAFAVGGMAVLGRRRRKAATAA